MPEFAIEQLFRKALIEPDQSFEIALGPPTPGAARVLLAAEKALDPGDLPDPAFPDPGPGGLGGAGSSRR